MYDKKGSILGHLGISRPTYFLTSFNSVVRALVCQLSGPGLHLAVPFKSAITRVKPNKLRLTISIQSWYTCTHDPNALHLALNISLLGKFYLFPLVQMRRTIPIFLVSETQNKSQLPISNGTHKTHKGCHYKLEFKNTLSLLCAKLNNQTGPKHLKQAPFQWKHERNLEHNGTLNPHNSI